jgi:hypothetical protein
MRAGSAIGVGKNSRSRKSGASTPSFTPGADSTMVDGMVTRPPHSASSRAKCGRTESYASGKTISAELGTHIALRWPKPACMLDPYIEFRHFTNDGAIKGGEREKGFYSIGGALTYFGEDGIDAAHKKDMRTRIIQGPLFTNQERADILDYCENDVDALVRLVPHIVPTIRSLPHAMLRAEFMWPTARNPN